MRTTGQIRFEENIKLQQNKDSYYNPIERPTRRFNKLKIPKSIQAELPFASKPKLFKKRSNESYVTRRAVIQDESERKVTDLIKQINTIRNEKKLKAKAKSIEKRAEYIKKKSAIEKIDDEKKKERSKLFFEKEGKKRAREEASNNGGGGRKKVRK
jgi:ribosome biogenesis protein BMS1